MRFWHRHHPEGAVPTSGPSIPLPKELSTEFRTLEPGSVRFFQGDEGLGAEVDGKRYEGVKVVPLFPLSERDGWVSVIDGEGKEIGILERLSELEPEDGELVREELRRRYLVPKILRVLSCRERFGLVEWEVETDRGHRMFRTRNLRETMQQVGNYRLMFSDIDGNRYDIPDLRALDPQSRAWIEKYS